MGTTATSTTRQPRPGEPLFEFVRASERAPKSCEQRFHGESYGWEAQTSERGELLVSRGGFALRELAVRWTEHERSVIGNETPLLGEADADR